MQYLNNLKIFLPGKKLLFTTLLLSFFTTVFAQTVPCRSDFDVQISHNTNTVFLDGKSNHSPVVFGWYTGDGQFLRGDSISHTYDSSGEYKICMVAIAFNATTNQRCTTRVCKTINIVNCDRLRTGFAFEVDGLTIKAKGRSNVDSVSVGFTFGDGTGERGFRTSHTYDKPGVYEVCFIVEDLVYGCRKKVCQRVLIEKEPCNIRAAFESETKNLGVGVKAKSNLDNAHYFWSFGDGNDATGQSARHVYKKPGIYVISLIVFNPETKCKKLICKRVLVEKDCKLKAVLKSRIAGGNAYFSVRTNASFRSKYKWDFGDGTVVTTTRKTIRHTYTKRGVYKVSVIVMDRRRKCRVLKEKTIVIGAQATTQQSGSLLTVPSGNNVITAKEIDESTWAAKASPSPARNAVSFSSQDKSLAIVKVMDASGVEVLQSTSTLKNLDISILPTGFYYAHVTAADGSVTIVKFLKN